MVLTSSLRVGDRGISWLCLIMDVAGRCWAGCRWGCLLGCFWWCLSADVAGRCHGGCCLGCCWECRWWCLIAEWGGRCRGGCRGVVGRWGCCWWYLIVSGECCWWKLIVGVAGRRCGGCCPGCRGAWSQMSWRVSPIGCRLCRLYRVSWGIAGGVRSRIWVGGVVLGGGLALWIRVLLLMMREWDVAGRCCAGRGWWCAMAWIVFFGCYGFHTSAAEFCKFNQTAEKNRYHFMLFGVYAGIFLSRIMSTIMGRWHLKSAGAGRCGLQQRCYQCMRESRSDQRESQPNARRVPVSGTHVPVVQWEDTTWLGVEGSY